MKGDIYLAGLATGWLLGAYYPTGVARGGEPTQLDLWCGIALFVLGHSLLLVRWRRSRVGEG